MVEEQVYHTHVGTPYSQCHFGVPAWNNNQSQKFLETFKIRHSILFKITPIMRFKFTETLLDKNMSS